MSLFNVFRQRLAHIAPLVPGSRPRFAFKAGRSFQISSLRSTQQRLQFHTVWRQRNTITRRIRDARWNSSKPSPDPTPHLGSPKALSLSERMRKLSREYGWSALGVYLAFSALDFPFCFLAVRWIGMERIGHWEHVIVEGFWNLAEKFVPNIRQRKEEAAETAVEIGVVSDPKAREGGDGWGVGEAQKRNKQSDATIWTQLALAYAIHKSFIFIRVPLTAAVTPKVVKTLRGWGWDIGKRKPKSPPSSSS